MQIQPVAYGRPALAALHRLVGEAKAADPMVPVTIVVPNNLAGVVARRYLTQGWGEGRNGVAAIELTTLRRLAERIAAPAMGHRRPLTPTVRAAAWRTGLSRHKGLLASIAEHPATVAALTTTDDELRMVDDEVLDRIAATTAITAEVVSLHRAVHAAVADDWYDEADLLRAAAEVPMPAPGAVVLYLPQELSQPERELIEALDQLADLRVLLGLTGIERADAAVLRAFPTNIAPTRPTPANGSAAMSASDSDDEVRWVVRQVVDGLASHRAERIAVLYAGSAPYPRLLQEHFAAADITINGPGVRSVRERAVARFVLGLLGWPQSNFSRVELFRSLAEVTVLDHDGERIPLAQWERVARIAGVVSDGDWSIRLDTYRRNEQVVLTKAENSDDDRQALIERTRGTIATIDRLQVFVARLRDQMETGAELTSWSALASWASEFCDLWLRGADQQSLPAEEAYALAAIRSALVGIAALDRVEGEASLAGLCDVLDQGLSRTSSRVGRFGEGVFVGPLDAPIGLDADVVFVLGLSEDRYPGRPVESALLPDAARIAAGTQLRQPRDELDRRHRQLQVALSAAPQVVVSFPRGDLRRSAERLPSRFVLPTLRDLSDDHALAATDWASADYGSAMATAPSYAGELLTTKTLATEQEWRIRSTSATRTSADPAVLAAAAMLDARDNEALTAYDGHLGPAAGLPAYRTGDPSISPTSLESYAACPYAFFARRLLRVEPLEDPDDIVTISALDIGTLMHGVLDDLVQEAKQAAELPMYGQAWSADHRRRLVAHLRARERDFLDLGLTGHPRLWAGEQRRIEADLLAMIDDDDEWRRTRQAAVLDSELSFGLDGRPGVELAVARGTILLRGSADKLDGTADGGLIITDVKTGGYTRYTDIEKTDPFVRGTKLQLPAYALAARKLRGEPDTPVSAAYWFVRKENRRIAVDLTEDLLVRFAGVVSTLTDAIAAGLFPAKAPESPDWGDWVQCAYCNPDGMGHGGVRDHWERKRRDPVLAELVALIDPPAVAP